MSIKHSWLLLSLRRSFKRIKTYAFCYHLKERLTTCLRNNFSKYLRYYEMLKMQ